MGRLAGKGDQTGRRLRRGVGVRRFAAAGARRAPLRIAVPTHGGRGERRVSRRSRGSYPAPGGRVTLFRSGREILRVRVFGAAGAWADMECGAMSGSGEFPLGTRRAAVGKPGKTRFITLLDGPTVFADGASCTRGASIRRPGRPRTRARQPAVRRRRRDGQVPPDV